MARGPVRLQGPKSAAPGVLAPRGSARGQRGGRGARARTVQTPAGETYCGPAAGRAGASVPGDCCLPAGSPRARKAPKCHQGQAGAKGGAWVGENEGPIWEGRGLLSGATSELKLGGRGASWHWRTGRGRLRSERGQEALSLRAAERGPRSYHRLHTPPVQNRVSRDSRRGKENMTSEPTATSASWGGGGRFAPRGKTTSSTPVCRNQDRHEPTASQNKGVPSSQEHASPTRRSGMKAT